MTTLRAGLDTAVGNAGIDVALEGDIGKLVQAGELLLQLISDPPGDIGDLVQRLGSIDLPSLGADGGTGGLLDAFGSLGELLPSDAGAGLSEALERIGDLQGVIGGDVPGLIVRLAACIETIQALLDAELFTTLGIGRAGGGGDGGGDGGGGDGGGDSEGDGAGGEAGDGEAPAEPSVEQKREERIAAIAQVQGVLDTFPDPFEGEALLRFVYAKLTGFKRELIPLPQIPLYDDLVDSLGTVIVLLDADADGLREHVESSLGSAASYMQLHTRRALVAVNADMDAARTHLDASTLRGAFDDLLSVLPAIGDAVALGDVSGAQPQIDAMQAALDQVLPRLDTLHDNMLGAPLTTLTRRLQDLSLDLERGMREVVHRLQPPFATSAIGGLKLSVEEALAGSGIGSTAEHLATLLGGAVASLDALEVESLSEPLSAVESALDTAVNELDAALATVAGETAALFDGVDQALAEVDSAALQDALENALADLQQQLRSGIDELFAPVRDAVNTAIGEIVAVAGALDLESVRDKLEEVIDGIAGVFEDPEVLGALEEIRGTVDQVVAQVSALSFAPVTDEVIRGIEEITDTLRSIDTSALDDLSRNGIQLAVEVLPVDLSPITDPLIDEFQVLVEAGPQQFLDTAKARVDGLMAEVERFSPADLVGDRLGAPYDQLMDQLDAFEPTQLLSPVQDVLEGVRQEIGDTLDPGVLLAPVQSVYEGVTSQLDQLQPATLVAPLEEGLQGAIGAVLEVVPEEIITGVLDEIIARVQHVVEALEVVRGIIARVRGIMAALEDPEPAVRGWLDPLLTRIDGLADAPSLQPVLDNLRQRAEDLGAAQLRGSLVASLDPLAADLDTLDPTQLRTRLTGVYQRLGSSALAGVSPGPAKTQLETQLARLNPLDAGTARLLEDLATLRGSLQEALAGLDLTLATWEIRFFADGSPLAELRAPSVPVADLRSALRQSVETEVIGNLSCMLSIVGAPVRAFAPVIDEIDAAIESLSLGIGDLVSGPGSLGAIRDRIQALVDRVQAIDLAFLTAQLQEIFDAVKAKFDDVSPAALAAVLQAQFDELLDSLDVTSLLPAEDLADLDNSYQTLVDDLRALDPTAIIVESLQQSYDERILPLIAQFNLGEPLQVLIDRLAALDEELRREVERTNEAFDSMLQAASF